MAEISKKSNIAAAVLAGGNARRLGGMAKGTIKVSGDLSIVERLIQELACAGFSDVVIVSNDALAYRHYGVQVIPDLRIGHGPLGGIEAGLQYFADSAEAVLFVPCDLPNLTAREMSALKEAYLEAKAPVVFAETAGFFWHPLCAVVHNGMREKISCAINQDRRKIRDLWQQVKAVAVWFPEETAFFNINDPADWDHWRKVEQ